MVRLNLLECTSDEKIGKINFSWERENYSFKWRMQFDLHSMLNLKDLVLRYDMIRFRYLIRDLTWKFIKHNFHTV